MPRDVATRWNSTYEMLMFALDYREAIDTVCGTQRLNLRRYEMEANEWVIAMELRDVLKVGIIYIDFSVYNLTGQYDRDPWPHLRYSRMPLTTFLDQHHILPS